MSNEKPAKVVSTASGADAEVDLDSLEVGNRPRLRPPRTLETTLFDRLERMYGEGIKRVLKVQYRYVTSPLPHIGLILPGCTSLSHHSLLTRYTIPPSSPMPLLQPEHYSIYPASRILIRKMQSTHLPLLPYSSTLPDANSMSVPKAMASQSH